MSIRVVSLTFSEVPEGNLEVTYVDEREKNSDVMTVRLLMVNNSLITNELAEIQEAAVEVVEIARANLRNADS